jgi:hypothetical protein
MNDSQTYEWILSEIDAVASEQLPVEEDIAFATALRSLTP